MIIYLKQSLLLKFYKFKQLFIIFIIIDFQQIYIIFSYIYNHMFLQFYIILINKYFNKTLDFVSKFFIIKLYFRYI